MVTVRPVENTLVVRVSRFQTRRESLHEDEWPQLPNGSAIELQLRSTFLQLDIHCRRRHCCRRRLAQRQLKKRMTRTSKDLPLVSCRTSMPLVVPSGSTAWFTQCLRRMHNGSVLGVCGAGGCQRANSLIDAEAGGPGTRPWATDGRTVQPSCMKCAGAPPLRSEYGCYGGDKVGSHTRRIKWSNAVRNW